VYVALHALLSEPPTLIVSGINKGANVGHDVLYSGTVAAAREGILHGIPAISVSLDVEGGAGSPHHWGTAVHFVRRFLHDWVALCGAMAAPLDTHLNLNVPDRPLSAVKGVRVCRLGANRYTPSVARRTDPRGRDYFWIGGDLGVQQLEAGTDTAFLQSGWVTLTPVTVRQTNDSILESMRVRTDD
jgi:5'-nucleotidase